MISITIGYVSGIIAAVIFILQFLLPNALILVLVGYLKNEHSAVTWSVVERNLLSSMWPMFLRTDAAATRGVDTTIRLMTWMRPLALGLVAIAAVVTPLGLYDDIVPSKTPQSVAFAYVQDPGPMGYGTPGRSDLGFTRTCGNLLPLQCPGTTVEITYFENATYAEANITNDDYDTRIPRVLAELYQSGLQQQPQSVSSFFDIQARYYTYTIQTGVAHGAKYIAGAFRYLSNMVLNNAVEPVEGLVVDTVTGGIAFRNHSVPQGISLGAEWTEDLLWVEPETACADTNISVEFRIPLGNGFTVLTDLANISLVDNGGFANLVQEYPYINVTNAQNDPNLEGRAYKAAWLVNVYTMLVMNLTRPNPDAFGYMKSKVGDRHPVNKYQTPGAKLNGIYATNLWQSLLDPEAYISNYTLDDAPNTNYSNPFGLSFMNYSDIATLCSGAGGRDLANLTNVHVECGMIYGAAQRRDGSKSLVLEPETWWTQKVYTCATAMKATIKEVRFRWNTTSLTGNTLKSLTVVNVSDKAYPDKESMPLWGVETPGYELQDVSQLWGLIAPDLANSVNLSTIRAPHLYIPGYGGSGILSAAVATKDNLPAHEGLASIMGGIFQTSSNGDYADYSGGTNMAMYKRWRDYSTSAAAMGTIPNLIWTDLAANMLVGTRSWDSGNGLPPNLQKRDAASASSGETGQPLVPVTIYERQIRYHWPFAIPALLALLLFVVVLLAALLSVLAGKGVPARVRHYLFHLSSGRLLGEIHYPGECDKLAPTNQWLARVGKRPSDLHTYVQHTSGVGAAPSPFLGAQHDHMAGGVPGNEKENGMNVDTHELRRVATPLSESDAMLGQTRHYAPDDNCGGVGGRQRSQAL
ncbi:hypothetical protein G647_07619 [Cladophialophora carrionii CBS 160.54]|uniref:Uncharacterized protein n=1 Tax=Cladophialophora carrionii CBS 160.54 TaxID=1279043 RepID=V9D2Y0_9EURO|nr:uncharacterized protein G647_07619 [Cladophialophora carrionii CBS 160.54]ETI21274.1 hypothetical protein G647_07619 [Cladophialophora carrionii CBS 160.54]